MAKKNAIQVLGKVVDAQPKQMINEKLEKLKNELKNRKVRIMIIGLGSVGNYLLDYLVSMADENMEICVVGRNEEK